MQGYSNLKRELKETWDMPVRVIPAVVGALGTAPKKLKQWLSDRDWGNNCGIVQNYCLIFCKDTLKCS